MHVMYYYSNMWSKVTSKIVLARVYMDGGSTSYSIIIKQLNLICPYMQDLIVVQSISCAFRTTVLLKARKE